MNSLYQSIMGQTAAANNNNPLLQMLVSAYKSGGNPMAMLTSLAAQNPAAQEFLTLIQGRTPQQLEQVCRKMCAQKGLDFNAALAQVQNMLK